MFNNFISSILAKLKAGRDGNDSEDVAEIVQLISVSLFFDNKVTKKELERAEHIIFSIYDSDAKYVLNLTNERLKSYHNEYWLFKNDKEEIIKKILLEGRWIYAEYMISIFEADGLAVSEHEYIGKLKKLVEDRKTLLNELGIKV